MPTTRRHDLWWLLISASPTFTVQIGVTVVTDHGQQVTAAQLLLATGRAPRTAALNLPAAGVKTDEAGFILVFR